MPETNPLTPQTPLPALSWTAPVHPSHERSRHWYIAGSTVIVVLAAYGILSGAWSLALVALLVGALYFLTRDHTFPQATIMIDASGIRIGENGLPWDAIQGFWLLPTPAYTELHIVPKAKTEKELFIQTGTTDTATLRQTLEARIPELTDKHEHLLDAFIRLCKL